jgi:raffinose/stachyose/melibiose transport system permease protein
MTTTRWERMTTYAILIAFSFLALYPVLSIVMLAFHRKQDLVTGFAFPDHFDLSTFRKAWSEGQFGSGLMNSFIVASTVTVVSAILSIGTGYAFGTMRFRGDSLTFNVILLGLIFPYEATVIPLYYDFKAIGWTESYQALILPQIGQSVAFGTFWMRASFRSTPRSLVEAGRVDGANSFTVLARILLPTLRPALMTLSALVFIYTWNEFLLALVMNPAGTITTAPLGLSFFATATRAGDPTAVAAAAVLVALPIVVVYVFLQRHFIRGMLSGAIKE